MVFVPPFLVESITHPNFLPFLLKHSNSILIIEESGKNYSTKKWGGFHRSIQSIKSN